MDALLGLGSNVGDRRAYLRRAIGLLREHGVAVEQVSSLYETEPMDYTEQPLFLNAAVRVETDLEPEALLRAAKDVERELGRQRRFRSGPREIDIDILTYGDRQVTSERLTIPHPRMRERGFVQAPLAELAGGEVSCSGVFKIEGPEWADD